MSAAGVQAYGIELAPEGATIPRIIHQTYAPKAMRPELEENLARIKATHPDWEHRFYNDDDIAAFVAEHYGPRISRYFERINAPYGAVRADLFRYLLMYKVGGVYLDVKSRPLRSLDEVIRPDDRYLLAQWPNGPGERYEGFGMHPELAHVPGGEFQQWHVIAAPGHPFLAAVIARVLRNLDRYNPAIHGMGQHGVLRVTGPVAYTKAILPLLEKHPHRRVRTEADLGLEYSIYGGLNHRDRFVSHYAGSREPIIQVGPLTQGVASLVTGARAVKKFVTAPLRGGAEAARN